MSWILNAAKDAERQPSKRGGNMTKLLEIRESLRNLYGRLDIYIKAGVKFVLSFITLLILNQTIGYMTQINNTAMVLIIALICTFLPINMIAVILSCVTLLHLYALSLEVCLVAGCILLLMIFLYYRMAPENGYNAIMTPVLFSFRIPQVIPVSIGLLKDPFSSISMLCGVIWFFFLKGIKENETLLGASSEADDKTSKFTLVLQQIIGNNELYLYAAAFLITALVVYIIRRQAINHSWTVAICVGNVLNLIVILLGHYILGRSPDILWLVIGTVVSFICNFCIEFFMYSFDYSRIEKVQFEDDDYYYFVKAIPKTYLSTKEKQIKKINTNKKMSGSRREMVEEFDIIDEFLDDE